MKVFLSLVLFLFPYLGWAQSQPVLKPVSASELYVPIGFDDNDTNVQVVFEGIFPNSCYLRAEPKVEISGKKIKIQPQAYVRSGPCLTVLIPYQQEINLGMLEGGDYEVQISKAGQTVTAILPIEEARSEETDNYLYAPIRHARLISKKDRLLRLEGEFTNSCMKLKEIQIYVPSDQVVILLPIAEYDQKEGEVCAERLIPFVTDIHIDEETAPSGRYLFHIRSIGGNALNFIEDL